MASVKYYALPGEVPAPNSALWMSFLASSGVKNKLLDMILVPGNFVVGS